MRNEAAILFQCLLLFEPSALRLIKPSSLQALKAKLARSTEFEGELLDVQSRRFCNSYLKVKTT